jgi:tetratricopeptide (TPR) repeat protein
MKPEMRHAIMEKAVKALQAGKYSQALSTISKINKLKSQQDYKSLELEAFALFQQQKLERALSCYQGLLALCENQQQRSTSYKNMARAEKLLGLFSSAIEHFEQCFNLTGEAENADIAPALGECYLEEDRYQDLYTLAEKMKTWPGQFAPAQALLISSAKRQNQKTLTLSLIEELLSHSKFVEEWQLEFAIDTLMFIREHQQAEQLLQQAQIDFVNKAWIGFYQAELKARNSQNEQVIELLSDELIDRLDYMRQKAAFKLRAEAFDKQKNYSAAFSDFSAMASLNHQRTQGQKRKDKVAEFQKLDLSFIQQQQTDAEVEPNQQQPVFMMGFNRSGTTLLENILDTQQEVVALSETRSIYNLTQSITNKLNKRYPQDLATLSTEELQQLRQEYFSFVQSLNVNYSANSLIVDKFPLYTIDLPFILQLFPKAKIIFCLRHPIDTCLSNFQQNSANNQEQAWLNQLGDCFKRYQQVFTLFKRYQAELPLNIHFVRYEDLVENLEQEASKVFEFLGITANNSYLDFDKHAQQKIVMSASSNQVVKSIYTESRYKWHNYQSFLQAHIPKVAEFIEQFAYQSK